MGCALRFYWLEGSISQLLKVLPPTLNRRWRKAKDIDKGASTNSEARTSIFLTPKICKDEFLAVFILLEGAVFYAQTVDLIILGELCDA